MNATQIVDAGSDFSSYCNVFLQASQMNWRQGQVIRILL